MNPLVVIFPDLDSLSLAATKQFSDAALAAVRQHGQALVALSGGSTPVRLFHRLASAPFSAQIPWEAVHFFWCDERCVPPDDPESNYGQARQVLFGPLNLPEKNLHRIAGELEPEQAALVYTELLGQFKAPGLSWPIFDLVLLGLGADGHTASLFPGAPLPEQAPVLAVTADYQGRPARRVTLTPLVLNSARQVIFMVAGAEKAEAVKHALLDPPDSLRYPAQRIQPIHGALHWLVDAAAAEMIHSLS
jgi:6-phosphogluconolactonase